MSDQPTNAHRTLFDNVMVKAWSDPAFKSKLLTDPSAALATFDARLPAGMVMKVVENTENLDHLVIPMRPAGDLSDENIAEATGIRLDSATGGSAHFMPFCKWCPFCLGLIRKAWSDPAFKAQLLTDPRAAVTATGADVRKDEEITVLENTDLMVYLVLPPAPTGELSSTDLETVAAGTTSCWLEAPRIRGDIRF